MKKLLIAALATVMTQQAMAVNWYLFGETSDGKFYIDLDSIQADTLVNGTPVMTVWGQTELKQAKDWSGKKFWTIKSFEYYDCRARKFATEFAAFYDKQGGMVGDFNSPSFSRYSSADWVRTVPGTPSETKLNIVCAYAN